MQKSLHYLALISALFLYWFILSSSINPIHICLGIFSCVITCIFAVKAGIYKNTSYHPFTKSVKLAIYWTWLIKEIGSSGLKVAKLIWLSPIEAQSRFLWIKLNQNDVTARIIYANSITLTPGTVCLDIKGDTGFIHVLSTKTDDDIDSLLMSQKIQVACGGRTI